jgi:hypothetical protein
MYITPPQYSMTLYSTSEKIKERREKNKKKLATNHLSSTKSYINMNNYCPVYYIQVQVFTMETSTSKVQQVLIQYYPIPSCFRILYKLMADTDINISCLIYTTVCPGYSHLLLFTSIPSIFYKSLQVQPC